MWFPKRIEINMKSDHPWAVTSDFNPLKYRTKRDNDRIFRRNLSVPLITVELVDEDQPELGPDDAEILIQLCGCDVMWQKERMMNIAINALPQDCRKVAWLDCDIVFQRSDWHLAAAVALEGVRLVQLFQYRVDVEQNAPIESVDWSRTTLRGSAFRIQSGSMMPELLTSTSGPSEKWRCATGLAWAGWRDTLAERGLYDARILGGGDRAITCAAWGMMDGFPLLEQMNSRQCEHYFS